MRDNIAYALKVVVFGLVILVAYILAGIGGSR